VASYSRGMRVLTESGGVTTTVVKRSMQRARCFMFQTAREARDFGEWLVSNFRRCEGRGRVHHSGGQSCFEIEQYPLANLLYLRFNYTTGDAAGQNMTGKATFAACEWIRATHPAHRSTCSRAASTPTRSTPPSTPCARAAGAWSPRP